MAVCRKFYLSYDSFRSAFHAVAGCSRNSMPPVRTEVNRQFFAIRRDRACPCSPAQSSTRVRLFLPALASHSVRRSYHDGRSNRKNSTAARPPRLPQTPPGCDRPPRSRRPRPGLAFTRHFTQPGVSPYDRLTWERRTAAIIDSNGKVIFEQKDVEVPQDWSMTATNIVASKYLHGQLDTPERETGVVNWSRGLRRRFATGVSRTATSAARRTPPSSTMNWRTCC